MNKENKKPASLLASLRWSKKEWGRGSDKRRQHIEKMNKARLVKMGFRAVNK